MGVPNRETLIKDAKTLNYIAMAAKYGCTVHTLYKHFAFIPKELRPKPAVVERKKKQPKAAKKGLVATIDPPQLSPANFDSLALDWSKLKNARETLEKENNKAFWNPVLKVSIEQGVVLLDRLRA